MIGKLVHRSCRRAVDAQAAGLAFVAALRAGADLDFALDAIERGKNGKAALGAVAHDILIGGAAQPAAGRQEGHGLHQVRLARAVLPREHDMPVVEANGEARIVAEIRQR